MWGLQSFGNVRVEINELNPMLEKLRSNLARMEPSHDEMKIVDRIVELNHQEEIVCRQRSRIMWLTASDKNNQNFSLAC